MRGDERGGGKAQDCKKVVTQSILFMTKPLHHGGRGENLERDSKLDAQSGREDPGRAAAAPPRRVMARLQLPPRTKDSCFSLLEKITK